MTHREPRRGGTARAMVGGGLLAVPLAAFGSAWASESASLVRPRLVERPSSRQYVALDELGARFGAEAHTEDRTGIHRLRRGERVVAVAPGLAAALIGWRLVELDRQVMVRYGRAYVPRDAEGHVARFLGQGVVPEPRETMETPRVVRPEPTRGEYFQRICIDPGHGGKDPGAGRAGLYERDIVLPVAKMLAAELRQREMEPVLTRERDVFIELSNRPAIAARKGADAFVSIHANAFGKSSIHGIEIFYCDGRYDSVDLAKDAARAGREPQPEDVGGDSNLPTGSRRAALQMLFEEYHRESRDLAHAIRDAFKHDGFYVRSVRSAPYRVLRLAESPAVLVELGFLTNRAERAKLARSSYQRKLADGIADGVADFRRTLERTHGLAK